MSILIDANVGLAQVISLPYSEHVIRLWRRWRSENVGIIVSTLWWYEYVTGVRRAIFLGLLSHNQGLEALEHMASVRFDEISPSAALNRSTLIWAERLGQSKAYDAHYLALAEQFGVEFWTADKRLYNRAHQVGASWVQWIMESL